MKAKTLIYLSYLSVIFIIGIIGAGTIIAIKIRNYTKPRLQIEGGWFADFNHELGFTIKKNANVHYREPQRELDFHIYTDSKGIRMERPGTEVSVKTDVVLIGASYLWGWGVEAEEAIPAILSNQFEVPVVSLAIPALSTLNAVSLLTNYTDIKPKFVVYIYTDEHLFRNVCPCLSSSSAFCQAQRHIAIDEEGFPYERPPQSGFFLPILGNRSAYNAIVKNEGFFESAIWGVRSALGYVYHQYFLQCRPNRKLILQGLKYSLRKFSETVRSLGATGIVVNIPSDLDRFVVRKTNPILLEALKDHHDLFFLDLTPAVERHYRAPNNASLKLEKDHHPSPAGHRLFATEIQKKLELLMEPHPERPQAPGWLK